jgi:predicted RNase H-like nuclease (RuvC/YqgF family)
MSFFTEIKRVKRYNQAAMVRSDIEDTIKDKIETIANNSELIIGHFGIVFGYEEDRYGVKHYIIESSEIDDQVTENTTKIEELEQTVTDLENEVNTLSNKVTNLEGDVSTLQSQVSSLNSEVNTLNNEVNDLDNRVSSLESSISFLNSHHHTYSDDNGDTVTTGNTSGPA